MSNNGGITSQKYFAYQKAIFVIIAFQKLSSECEVIYEGTDDIDLYNVFSPDVCIQVKGGNGLSRSGVYDVLTNWLNIYCNSKNIKFQLVCENVPAREFSDISFDEYYNHCFSHKNERSDSKYAILFNNYQSKEEIEKAFSNIVGLILKTKIVPIDILNDTVYQAYQTFCGGPFESLDRQRSIVVSRKVFNFIEENVLFLSNSTKLTVNTLNSFVAEANRELPIESYNFQNESFDFDEDEARQLLSESDNRLVAELKKVRDEINFLMREIRNEMEYEFFRDTYAEDFESEINSLERRCFSNYQRASIDPTIDSSYDLYSKFGLYPNPSSILADSADARYGCANYLASDNNDDDAIRIKWER